MPTPAPQALRLILSQSASRLRYYAIQSCLRRRNKRGWPCQRPAAGWETAGKEQAYLIYKENRLKCTQNM
jgi:hypothetical protein